MLSRLEGGVVTWSQGEGGGGVVTWSQGGGREVLTRGQEVLGPGPGGGGGGRPLVLHTPPPPFARFATRAVTIYYR